MADRRLVTWMVDSGSRESLHLSGPQMAKDTYLGHIRRDGEDWYFVELGGKEHGPFSSLGRCRREAVMAVGGEIL